MPAVLKAFLEQLLRPGFAYHIDKGQVQKLLAGKSARVIVTMVMPAIIYRWYFAHMALRPCSVASLGLSASSPCAPR